MRILTQSQVRDLIKMDVAVQAVESAFVAYGRGETQMPPKVYLDFPNHNGDLRAMPAAMGAVAGLKWVNSHPDNPAKYGLPSVMGLYVLSDPATAKPLAMLDATLLTAVRTGAAAAVASKYLGHRHRTFGMIGCGVQSDFLIEAHRVLYPTIEVVAADRVPTAAERVVERWGGRVGSVADAAACDIVCVATPSRAPIIGRDQVQLGAHINAMGADAEGKQELDAALLQAASVFVDDFAQASHSGEINVPLSKGELKKEDIAGSICDVVAEKALGRPNAEAITVFDSTGLAIQDLALAQAIFEAAKAKGVGIELDLRA
ncbi:MAG: ornithine cyclodeaminase family protein [Myxococcota bacterium]